MITRRAYQKESDIHLLQTFTAQQRALTDGCGCLHPGDVFYHVYAGNRDFDPAEFFSIWEDEQGVAAWMLAAPHYKGFDAEVRTDLRGGELEKEVLTFAEERTLAMMKTHGIESKEIYADAHRCDSDRKKVLLHLGWKPDIEAEYVLNRQALTDLPSYTIAEGYMIRPVSGFEEAGQVAEVHNASFGSSWTTEQYLRMMQAPGYSHEFEFVAEAPDGTFAGFTLTWHDTINKTGLLEPVGVHRAHRRKGLGKSLVIYALHHMRESGMEYATVMNETANTAALNLYRSCGFMPWHQHDGYIKGIPSA